MRPSDLLREAAWLMRRAIATSVGPFDKAPIIAPLGAGASSAIAKLRRQRGLS